MKRYLLILSLLMIICNPLLANEKLRIAVIDLVPKGTSNVIANGITNLIRSEMVKTGLFTIIERSQMNEILKEQGFQQLGCTDQECAVQMGKLLSAKLILVGDVTKIGNSYIITVRIVDVEKGTADFSANEKAASEDSLDIASTAITKKLADSMTTGNRDYFVSNKVAARSYYLRGFVPGWAQVYGGNKIKGYSEMGIFAGAAGFTAYMWYDHDKKSKAYDSLGAGASQDEFNAKFNDKKNAGKLFNIGTITTLALYALNWIDLLILDVPTLAYNGYYVNPGLLAVNSGDFSFNVGFGSTISQSDYINNQMETTDFKTVNAVFSTRY